MNSTVQVIGKAGQAEPSEGVPLACSTVPAGFPSPAEDWVEERLDLYKMLVEHPACTFFVQARGDSMREAGILDGDILVVDRVLRAEHGDIVIAVVDNDLTVKRLYKRAGLFRLQPANPTYPDIVPKDGQSIEIWGVVTASVTRHRGASHVRAPRR